MTATLPETRRTLLRSTKSVLKVFASVALVVYLMIIVFDRVETLVELQSDRFEGRVRQGDFEDYIAFYAAGQLVLEGRGEELYSTDVVAAKEQEIMGREVGGTGSLGYFNPPFVAVFFAPLALLSHATASSVLLLLNVAILLGLLVIVYRLLNLRGLPANVILILGILSLHSVFWLIGHGQFSLLLLTGFLSFFCLERSGHHRLSGLALTLLLFKPQMAVLPLIVLTVKGRWETLSLFGVVAGFLALVSIAVSGFAVLWDYPSFALSSTGWEQELGINVERMYGWNGLLATVVPNHSLAHITTTGTATLITIGLAVLAFRGPWRPNSSTFALAFGALVAGAILINPHVYMQDMVLMGLAMVLGFIGWRQSNSGRMAWFACAAIVWFSQATAYRMHVEFNLNTQTILLALLFGFLVWTSTSAQSTGQAALEVQAGARTDLRAA